MDRNTSSLEPTAGKLSRPERPEQHEGNGPSPEPAEPPQVRKLWARVKWLFILNICLAAASALQAYFAFRSNELTRVAIQQAAKQHSEALLKSREMNDAVIAEAKASREQTERLTRETLKESQEATRLSAAALKTSQDANVNSREAFRVDQRAWILVNEVNLPEFDSSTREVSGEITVKNVGRSPAMEVTPEQFARISRPFTPSPPSRIRVCTDTGCTPLVVEPLGSGVERRFRFEKEITAADFEALARGEVRFAILGSVLYKDIFGEVHYTAYCYQASRLDQPAATARFNFVLCSEQNQAR